MVRKRNGGPGRLLTSVELELMRLVWAQGRTTVKDVMAALPRTRKLAYTSVATIMRILEQKKFLRCEKDAHAHVFYPAVSREEYEATCIKHMVSHVFGGEPVALVQRLLSAKDLSREELAAIEATLRDLQPGGRRPS